MKRIDLKLVDHEIKIGMECKDFEPNICEDSIFYEDGVPVGFFIKEIPEKLKAFIEIANNEFLSKRVPKVDMLRTNGSPSTMKKRGVRKIKQMSTIIGSVGPKPHLGRNYASLHSNHSKKSTRTFIKSMLLACREAENLIQEITPNIFDAQLKLIEENVPKKYRFGRLFTSSISNFNISAQFHRDNGNIKGCVNVIITKRSKATGGNLHVPDYNATMDSTNNSMLVYPAWKNVHGVTPINPKVEGGYRNSLIFYPLKAFKGLK
jgi:hypothetical protein